MKRKGSMRGKTKIDRAGNVIATQVWTRHRGNAEYTIVAEYENDKFGIYIEWLGVGDNEKVVPKEYWKIFKVHAYNIITAGNRPGTYVKKKIPDPELTSTFANEKGAVAYYQAVLLESGLAEVEEDYQGGDTLVEKGNKLAKESVVADTLDKPHSVSKVTGSW